MAGRSDVFATDASQGTPLGVLSAEPHWACVDLISDLHLQESEPATFACWQRYLQTTAADAVFILGDLFEAWVGDDVTQRPGFEAQCAHVLTQAAQRQAIFFLHGNRDFLVGADLAAATGIRLMADPTVLAWGSQRWLLTHGDALCLADTDYLEFREQVRAPEWIRNFLAQPLDQRLLLARQMRSASQAHQQARTTQADVDPGLARQWLAQAAAPVMVHGHTHRPAEHDLGQGLQRIVLSDWDALARPPRLQALRLWPTGRHERVALA